MGKLRYVWQSMKLRHELSIARKRKKEEKKDGEPLKNARDNEMRQIYKERDRERERERERGRERIIRAQEEGRPWPMRGRRDGGHFNDRPRGKQREEKREAE